MSEVHGKFSGDSEYYAAEKYGTQYTGKIGEIKVPPTQNQLDAQDLFATAREEYTKDIDRISYRCLCFIFSAVAEVCAPKGAGCVASRGMAIKRTICRSPRG